MASGASSSPKLVPGELQLGTGFVARRSPATVRRGSVADNDPTCVDSRAGKPRPVAV